MEVDYRALGYDRILVALDGSEMHERVLERAIILAANERAELVVAHVIDTAEMETIGVWSRDLIEQKRRTFTDSIAAQLAEAEAVPSIAGVRVVVTAGRVREALAELMGDVRPDLVVCGNRRLSGMMYAVLGSVSASLVKRAPCDVLVVKG